MAALLGTKTSYSDTTPQKRTVSDYISLISPQDVPLIAYFGIQSSPPAGFSISNWPNTTVELLYDSLLAVSDPLSASITSTATTITMTDAGIFHEGDVGMVGTEIIWFSARSASGEIWTVVRSVAGTTNASHASAAVVTVIGNARLEGATNAVSSYNDITSGTNYTQIFHESVQVTRTAQKMSQYGIDGEYEYQMMKHQKEALRKLENTLVQGRLAAGSATVARMMGGLEYWINSSGGNTVSAGGAVVQADFEDALEAIYADGGMGTDNLVALVNPANMQVIKNFYDSSLFLRVARDEKTVGMTVTQVLTPFGTVDLLMSRWATTAVIPIINPEHFAILAYDDFFTEDLAQTGDSRVGELIGEFTCLVREPLKAHGAIVAIS